ncbi:hypothetical protein HMPREF9372_1196 [Sporosarcina newyorkensis 2681]|uniref:Uncharacterized protein n=1 Tax=Sporosarcina newyorkensis 2681 TaxID=1027292 RepID=F9DQW6_9BACL|nr:hypothetical protein HMPREF9372_1196 [Sporosarcina newyorkensis 2681]
MYYTNRKDDIKLYIIKTDGNYMKKIKEYLTKEVRKESDTSYFTDSNSNKKY